MILAVFALQFLCIAPTQHVELVLHMLHCSLMWMRHRVLKELIACHKVFVARLASTEDVDILLELIEL